MSLSRKFIIFSCLQMALLLTGCGTDAASKSEEPAEVEKNRQAHQEAMQKELGGGS